VALLSFAAGCASDPNVGVSTTTNPAAAQNTLEASLNGVKVTFNYSDYFSLTAPYPGTGCAGDVKNYYDPLAIDTNGNPVPYQANAINTAVTIMPAFVKNISVDLTDANANVSTNLAFGCSLGDGSSSPGTSNCSTFDYGAIGGIPTNLGGTLLLIGGIAGQNYSGYNSTSLQNSFSFHGPTVSCGPVESPSILTPPVGYSVCSPTMYSLAIDALPPTAATTPPSLLAPGIEGPAAGPISTFSNLGGASNYVGPDAAGAAAAYNPNLEHVILFGGSSPLTSGSLTGASSATSDTWIYDLHTQAWTKIAATAVTDTAIQTVNDCDPNVSASGTTNYCLSGGNPVALLQLNEGLTGRALFGYTAIGGMALKSMSSDGTVSADASQTSAKLDSVERIVVVGGLGNASGSFSDTHRFNPTFGPDLVDALPVTTAVTIVQWANSYHTQLMDNSNSASLYKPLFDQTFSSGTTGHFSVNFGLTGLLNYGTNFAANQNPAGSGLHGKGYVVAAGGFDPTIIPNTVTANGGVLSIKAPSFDNIGSLLGDTFATSAVGVPAFQSDVSYAEATPYLWSSALSEATDTVPWYGGVSLVPGLNLTTNDVVYFGGSDCYKYLTDNSVTCHMTNPGRYWSFGANPLSSGNVPANTALPGPVPSNAGMASVRGSDGANPIVVAFGGMTAAATPDSSGSIYYLSTVNNTKQWNRTIGSGTFPTGVGNGSLVYSHVTGKFYYFGGYNPVNNFTSGDIWELSITSAAGCGSTAACAFAWTQLDTTSGRLACYPNCPPARRSHRMVEVSYNNGGSQPSSKGDHQCTDSTAPCSYGIFMEGGTSDGSSYLADRWMFDPTANGGAGLWEEVDGLPPRTLAAMASVTYTPQGVTQPVHRSILFGGESGMQSPEQATGRNFFVPPTFADTWMLDEDSSSWHRVQLLGVGVATAIPMAAGVNEFLRRQEYDALVSDPEHKTLSPPPLSGSVMVVRTRPMATPSPWMSPFLAIPEVYLFGGRGADGSYQPLSNVYKFCAGSTGEANPALPNSNTTQSGQCDAYDPYTNPNSPSPGSGYYGRWLYKNSNTALAAGHSSFMGAATYDSDRDRIVLFGGRSGAHAVTDLTITSPNNTSDNNVYEYTPPAHYGDQGLWSVYPACSDSIAPAPRYGHSLGYNPLSRTITLVGGYALTPPNSTAGNIDGTPLVTELTYYDGTTYTIPEVWNATFVQNTTYPAGCYEWSLKTIFGNSLAVPGSLPPAGGLGHAASVYVPPAGFNTGYYSMFDSACVSEGPLQSSDPTVNSLLAGGAYFDIDRTQLGALENLILNVTIFPLGSVNQSSSLGQITFSDDSLFRVHLIHTGQTGDAIRQVLQPRYISYADTAVYPETVQTLSILAPPTGQITQEQILIPLSADPGIDRIRIERYSGSAILIDASLFRMGTP
jgi:hypothetical protein